MAAMVAGPSCDGCADTVPADVHAPSAVLAPAPVGGSTVVTYAEGRRAHLHRPPGRGPFPVIVYNHGSEAEPPNFGGQAKFYVPRGFIVLAPHRRGHGLSRDAAPYAEGVLARRDGDPEELVALLETQLDDVAAAVAYARSRPEVDAHAITVAGCSLGGVLSLMMAERDHGLHAAIDFAGAAIMWEHNPPLRARMLQASTATRVPVLFVQAENDFSTAPSTSLAAAMQRAQRPGWALIFPPHGTSAHDGHTFCAGGDSPLWGEAVASFLRQPHDGPPPLNQLVGP